MADEKSTKKKTSTAKKSGARKQSMKGVDTMNASPKKKANDLARREEKRQQVVRKSWLQPDVKPGDNTRYLSHSLRLADLPLCPMDDEKAVQERCIEYFKICTEDDMKPSVTGLALAIGVDTRYLWEIREGKKGKNPLVAEALKKSMRLLELQMVDYMQEGKVNPVVGIFLSKNHFGYRDQQDVVVAPQSALGDEKSAEEIRQRYIDSIADPGTIEGTAEEISEK